VLLSDTARPLVPGVADGLPNPTELTITAARSLSIERPVWRMRQALPILKGTCSS
jgi:hypothetical protein